MKGEIMKKLLLVLLVVALAAFLLVGCIPVTPGEGEGEGEGETTEVGVAIEGAVVIDGKTYVSAGSHEVTITFPSPVAGYAEGYLGYCTGDYSKSKQDDVTGLDFVLFPDATKKIWTGSVDFGYYSSGECCASYIEIYAGECEDVACIWFPVIVDGEDPYATVELCLADCTCAGCEIVFSSYTSEAECLPDEVICDDDCSGFASWSIDIYDVYPFDECCDVPCVEPIDGDTGVCPIDFTTICLEDSPAYVVVTLVDNVGNSTKFGATVTFNPDTCDVMTFVEWPADDCVDTADFVYCEEFD
jgi:predicted small secreted protein